MPDIHIPNPFGESADVPKISIDPRFSNHVRETFERRKRMIGHAESLRMMTTLVPVVALVSVSEALFFLNLLNSVETLLGIFSVMIS